MQNRFCSLFGVLFLGRAINHIWFCWNHPSCWNSCVVSSVGVFFFWCSEWVWKKLLERLCRIEIPAWQYWIIYINLWYYCSVTFELENTCSPRRMELIRITLKYIYRWNLFKCHIVTQRCVRRSLKGGLLLALVLLQKKNTSRKKYWKQWKYWRQ